MKTLVRIPFKLVLLPIIALVAAVYALGMALLKVSCYVMGPLMLALAGCGIYGIVTQTWYNLWIALGCEAACALVMFGGAFILSEMDALKDWLISL